jgi:ferrous iron transport protein B
MQPAVKRLVDALHATYPALPNARWVALRLLDGDQRIAQALRRGELADLASTAPQTQAGSQRPLLEVA